jgi:hypothetical protein
MAQLQAQQIVALATQIAKCPGFTSQGGQFLNATLQDLCQDYDLEAAQGTYVFSFNSVTGQGSGPYTLPTDYLRARVSDGKDDFFYTINGQPYPLIQVTKAEYDWMVQTPGFTSFPYYYATDLAPVTAGQPGQLFVWPPANGSYPCIMRYWRQMPDIVTPETSAVVPWFANTDILVTSVAGRLMAITGDERYEKFTSEDIERVPTSWKAKLAAYLKNVEDREGAVHTVGRDRRRWGRNFDTLRNTKQIGWALAFMALALTWFVQPEPAKACTTPCTKTQLLADITTNWPDNTTGLITPAILRSQVTEIINSYYDTNGLSSVPCASHNWVSGLPSVTGITCTQPAFTDISGAFISAQCFTATAIAIGCVRPDGTTITVSGAGVITAIGAATIAVDAGGATSVSNGTPGPNQCLDETAAAKIGVQSCRNLLTTNITYFVRTVPVAVTISNASPGIVTHTAHGYLAGQLVTFNSTTSLPTGLTAGTIYCVLAAGLATNTYEVGATCGGAAINTSSAGSGTFTEQAGNDLTGTGLAQTATAAFMTLQGAANYISQNVDTGPLLNIVTVQAGCAGGGGTALYTTGLQVLTPFTGSGLVKFVGDTTTASNCLVSVNSAAAFQATFNGVRYQIAGFRMTNSATGGDDIYVSGGAQLDIVGPVDFGAVSATTGPGSPIGSGAAQIELNHGALYNTATAWTISGGGARHIYMHNGGYIENAVTATATVTGTPTFVNTVLMYSVAVGNFANMTYSGSATGQRYSIQNNSDMETGGGGANYFPGNTAGGVIFGGIYN